MPRSLVVAVISSLALLASCSGSGDEPVPAPPPAPAAQDPRSRALAVPKLADGEPCPRTKGRELSAEFAPGLGPGPAYPVGVGTDGMLDELQPPERFESKEWGGQKVLWVVEPSYDGPVLIRGRQLDGPNEVRFDEGDVPSKQIWMPAEDAPDERWRERPSYTRLHAPGCYAYQVDGPDFSVVVVFEAKPVSK
jgi:hypothetical protein